MHYLMLNPEDMLLLLHTQSFTVINEYKTIVFNFIDKYDEIQFSESINSLKEDIKEEIINLSGVKHPLKLRALMSKLKTGEHDTTNEELNKASELMQNRSNYDGKAEIEIPKELLGSLRYTENIINNGEVYRYSLTKFQKNLLDYTHNNLIRDSSKIRFKQNLNTELEFVKSQYSVPAIWGVQLQTVIDYLSPYTMLNRIQDSLADFNNKLEELNMFKKNYLDDDSTLNTLDKVITERYSDLLDKSEITYKEIIVRLIKDSARWDYKSLNEKLGTYMSEYEMMLQIIELETLGFIGIWHNSDHTVKQLIANSKYNKVMNEVSKDVLLNNRNIKFLIDVMRPVLEGEVRYLNEI